MRILALLLLLISSVSPATTKKASGEPKVSYEKTTKLDFDEANVDGDFLSPDSKAVQNDRNVEFDSLLAPKNDFRKELKRSSGAIR